MNEDLKRTRRRTAAAVDLAKLDRLPPHSTEAEQGVLGCLLLDAADCLPAVQSRVKDVGEIFYDLRHQTIYERIAEMSAKGEPVDLITLRQRLKDAGQLDAVGGVAYLTGLVDATPSAANVPFYLDIVLEKFMLRRFIATCSSVIAQVYDGEFGGDVERLMDDLEKDVLSIRKVELQDESGMRALVTAVLEKKEADASGVKLRGLPSGFAKLDRWTRGLKPKNMIVIGARPSVGKTSLAMQMAERVALFEKKPVAVFSLEMSADELVELSVNRLSRVAPHDTYTHDEIRSMTVTAAQLSSAPLYIMDESGLTIGQMRAKARRLHQQHGLGLIVVDYLQLVRGDGRRESRTVEVTDVSMGMKAMAKELGVPVLVLAQLNREVDKRDGPPNMADLRDSGSIEADADSIYLLHTTKDEGDLRQVELRLVKNRGGRRGVIDLVFNGPLTEFREASPVGPGDE